MGRLFITSCGNQYVDLKSEGFLVESRKGVL